MRAFLIAACCLVAVPAAAVDYPGYQSFVTDYAGLLPAETRSALESKVQAYKQATSIEIAVLIVPTLQGDTPSHYAQEVWSQWHIGKKGEDNGVLLLVVPPPEKKAWIATGYGVQGWLTDIQAKHIIDEVMRPLNLQNRRPEAVVAGVDAIIGKLGNTPWAERAKKAPPAQVSEDWTEADLWFWLIVFVLVVICLIWLMTRSSRRSYYGGSYYSSGSSYGSGGWFSGGGGGDSGGGGFGGGDSGGGGGGGDSG
jgi:uncharacterized protein